MMKSPKEKGGHPKAQPKVRQSAERTNKEEFDHGLEKKDAGNTGGRIPDDNEFDFCGGGGGAKRKRQA